MAGGGNPAGAPPPAPQPNYNPIFERLVPPGATGDQIGGLVAYGLYKIAKREWAADIWDREHRAPNEAELRAYIASWTPSRLDGLGEQANGALAGFSASVIRDATPEIREDALRGTWASAIFNSMTANFFYTLLLILAVILLSWVGVDFLGILEKAKPKS